MEAIQEIVKSMPFARLESKVDAIVSQMGDLGKSNRESMLDINKQFDLASLSMQTALGMIFGRFQRIEDKVGHTYEMVIKFHDDWERRNLGMKKAIECIQSSILDILDRSQQFKHGVNEIATRVEANDQRLVEGIFEMYKKILAQQDWILNEMANISKAIHYDWGLLTYIEDLRIDFNGMLGLLKNMMDGRSVQPISGNLIVSFILRNLISCFYQHQQTKCLR